VITVLSKLIDHNEPFEFESDNETAEVEIDLQLSMKEKLAIPIDKEINSKINSKSRTPKDVMGIVIKELESCYKNLNSILLGDGTRTCFFWMWKNSYQNNLYMMRAWTC
jgi:hypothetical protein